MSIQDYVKAKPTIKLPNPEGLLKVKFFSKMATSSDTATTSIKKLPTIFLLYVLPDDISGMFKCTVDLL